MRRLVQPGPAPSERIEAALGHGRTLEYELQPGLVLIEALMRPVVSAGLRGGTAVFRDAVLSPFRYVFPGPATRRAARAWFSEPRAAPGSRIETANATLGWRDGAPFVHCHAVWTEPDGLRRGGHILPDKTVVETGATVRAWAVEDVSMTVAADPETNFSLFRPEPAAGGAGQGQTLILARIRPNQEIGEALSATCRRCGLSRAHVRGGVGSLLAPRLPMAVKFRILRPKCWCNPPRSGRGRGDQDGRRGYARDSAPRPAGTGRKRRLHHL